MYEFIRLKLRTGPEATPQQTEKILPGIAYFLFNLHIVNHA